MNPMNDLAGNLTIEGGAPMTTYRDDILRAGAESDRLVRPPAAPQATPARPAAAPKADTFESRYGHLLPKGLRFNPSRAFLDEFQKRTRPIFEASERKELARLCAWEKSVHAGLVAAGIDAARAELNRVGIANNKLISAGQAPTPLPDLAELTRKNELTRAHLRDQLRAIQIATGPIVKAILARLETSAEKLAAQLIESETKDAAAWASNQFVPSQAAQCCVFLRLQGCREQAAQPQRPSSLLWGAYKAADFLK